MLNPDQFDTSAALPTFFIEVEDLSVCGLNTGPVKVPVTYDSNWRPLLHLGGFLVSESVGDWVHLGDQPINFKIQGNLARTQLILTKLTLNCDTDSIVAEARLQREPLVIRHSDEASSFKGILLSAPNFYGRELVLIDRTDSEFRISSLKKSDKNSCVITSRIGFSADDPLKYLDDFSTFLTFIKGTHCGVGNIVSYNNEEGVAFKLLGFTRNDPLESKTNWYDIEVLSDLPDIFFLFSKAMGDITTREALKQAIEFYRASNASRDVSLEMSLIAAHSSLEAVVNYILMYRAGWSEKLVDKSQVKFSDKLRAASAFFGITGEIVVHSPELEKFGKSRSMDAFETISFFRNKIVHQDPKFRPSGIQLHEVWLISQWLVEVLIFSIIGHRGKIIDRRVYSGWRGSTCQIPFRS